MLSSVICHQEKGQVHQALVCFLAVPICVLCTCFHQYSTGPLNMPVLTLVANLRLVKVSLRCACSGLIMTNIRVFELPPREFCRR